MKMVPTNRINKTQLQQFFITHWGSPEMVISSGVYHCDRLAGFAALSDEEDIIGLITFDLREHECEIISLDSLEENKGIGSALIKETEKYCHHKGCKWIKLVTTNDNIHALGFYQRRGYRLVKIIQNAVDEARKIKPEIPLIADNGIPICDELVLEKNLEKF